MVNTEIRFITLFVAENEEAVYSQQKKRPGADWGSDHQLLITKFRLKLKKGGKTTRPARYDLNQIPYEYALEVMSRFKGLDLVNSVPEGLWMEVRNIEQEAVSKTIPKKSKKAKWLPEEASQIAAERREVKKQERKGKVRPTKRRVSE